MGIMSIVKLQISVPEAVKTLNKFKENRIKAFDHLTEEIRLTFEASINQLLSLEMEIFLGEADQADNKKNGHKDRDYTFKGIGTLRIKMPQDRKSQFKSDIIPKSERIDPRIKEDMAVMHLAGISNRTLAMISNRVLNIEVSKDTINHSMASIQATAIKWLERPLEKEFWALYVDGTYFNVQRRGSTEKEPMLVVLGIDQHDRRSILAIDQGTKDSADCWRTVFDSLIARGLNPKKIKIGIMDGLPGLEKAFKEKFPQSVTARCWVHASMNASNKCPERLSVAFSELLSNVMYANSQQEAKDQFQTLKNTMGKDALRAVSCIEKDLDSLVAHYAFDKIYWRALKTTNPIERVNKELKRRIKSMETIGESTLTILVAFTALRLEMGWKSCTVHDEKHGKYVVQKRKNNVIENGLSELLH